MKTRVPRWVLLALAVVFTAGLTFATLELPYLVDGFLQGHVVTPDLDSHVDEISRLKTELFMAHYHVRAIGYGAFFLLLALIVAGFVTRRSGFAVLGAFGVMLAVFAQFAGVMFFLAGLGILNALWLPVLDLSYELQSWGRIIDVPNDVLRWLLGLVGIHSPWPTIVLFVGAGILIFLLGTYAWLSARAGGRGVAQGGVYRFSRHPQYLGWILWTYGAYLLIGLARYPKRSWGIGASLPWLISTLVIVAVALVEELRMRERHGEAYESYRRSAPFVLPLPRWLTRALGWPFRALFGRDRPERVREVVTVVGLYGLVLIGVSAFVHGGGIGPTLARLAPPEERAERLDAMVAEAVAAPDLHARRFHMLQEVGRQGEVAVAPLVELAGGPDPTLRALSVEVLGSMGSERAVPALVAAASDSVAAVRHHAIRGLAAAGSPAARGALRALLDDPEDRVRVDAFLALTGLGDDYALGRAPAFLDTTSAWTRARTVAALGAAGSEEVLPLVLEGLSDADAVVRRDAVIALLRIGSPAARTALRRALSDPDFEVRVYAAETLRRLPDGGP